MMMTTTMQRTQTMRKARSGKAAAAADW